MAALQGYGISTSLAVRIYKKFGDESGAVITEEPYRLAREVWGIGFKTADKIAQAVGIAHDAPERLQAGRAARARGRRPTRATRCCPEPDLRSRAAALLGGRAGGDRRGRRRPAGERRRGRGDASTRPTSRLRRAGAVRPRRVRASPRACRRSRASATQTRAASIFGRVDWDAAFGWLADRHGLTLAPRAGGGRAHGADLAGRRS